MSAVAAMQPPDFSFAAAYPELERLAEHARYDWASTRAHIVGLPFAADRSAVVGRLAESDGLVPVLRSSLAADPDDPLVGTVLGAREIQLAWKARGDGWAKNVTREQFAAFRQHLVRAERLLMHVTAVDESFDAAWCERITSAMGLSLGLNEARRRYDRLTRCQPDHPDGQRGLLTQLLPKWGGSWEAAYEFAAECERRAAPGTLSAAMLLSYHTERWLSLNTAEQSGRRGYPRREQVRREVIVSAERSVLHPDFRPCCGWVRVHGMFAALFGAMNDARRAAVHFRALGDVASRYPWEHLGIPSAVFVRMRVSALARG